MICRHPIDFKIWCRTQSIKSQPHQTTTGPALHSLSRLWGGPDSLMVVIRTTKCWFTTPVHLSISRTQTTRCSFNKCPLGSISNSNRSHATSTAKMDFRILTCKLKIFLHTTTRLIHKVTYSRQVSPSRGIIKKSSHLLICKTVRNRTEIQCSMNRAYRKRPSTWHRMHAVKCASLNKLEHSPRCVRQLKPVWRI